MSEITYDTEVYHHGIKGMKWGHWNAETTARYNGVSFSKAGKSISDKAGSIVRSQKDKIQANIAEKREQHAHDKEVMKKYNLSSRKYKKLRETTLNSNDPTVVAKGMHLLSDKELNDKIDRLNREDKITKMAQSREKKQAEIKKDKAETRSKSLGYNIAKDAAGKLTTSVTNQIINPALSDTYKAVGKSYRKTLDKMIGDAEKAEEKNKNKGKKDDKNQENQSEKSTPSRKEEREARKERYAQYLERHNATQQAEREKREQTSQEIQDYLERRRRRLAGES